MFWKTFESIQSSIDMCDFSLKSADAIDAIIGSFDPFECEFDEPSISICSLFEITNHLVIPGFHVKLSDMIILYFQDEVIKFLEFS